MNENKFEWWYLMFIIPIAGIVLAVIGIIHNTH